MKVYNYAAGPSMIPEPIMKRAQREFRDYNSLGVGVLELSHRSSEFKEILRQARSNIRELLKIPNNYEICFIQGGASLQYAMIPMNFLDSDGFAEYADTGYWSQMAIKEVEKINGKVSIIASSKSTNYDRIPLVRKWSPDPDSSYLHITSNNTVYGTQYHSFPELENGNPLIADMSTDLMTRNIDIEKFGLVYASTQKTMGPTGVTIVIIRKDLLEKSKNNNLPSMLDYNTYVEEDSMHNTPPTFSIYLLMLVTEWIKNNGGLKAMDKINTAKSETIYEKINDSNFYESSVVPSNRSRVNIVFDTPSDELDKKFVEEAREKGLIGLEGHRTVKGLRASMYNAMPLEGAEVLIDFMNEFERRYG